MNKKGFTLIELVATIALLAIIVIISYVSINGVINQSKVNNCESLMMDIKTAAKEYVSDNRYNFNNNNSFSIFVEELINKKYLSGPIKNPFTKENIGEESIEIKITLKEDYSADSVSIYKKIDNSSYNCSEGWWNFE